MYAALRQYTFAQHRTLMEHRSLRPWGSTDDSPLCNNGLKPYIALIVVVHEQWRKTSQLPSNLRVNWGPSQGIWSFVVNWLTNKMIMEGMEAYAINEQNKTPHWTKRQIVGLLSTRGWLAWLPFSIIDNSRRKILESKIARDRRNS